VPPLLLCTRLLRLPFCRDNFGRNNWVSLRRPICINWSVDTISRSRITGTDSSISTGFGDRYSFGTSSRVDNFGLFCRLDLIGCLSRHARDVLWLHGCFLLLFLIWDLPQRSKYKVEHSFLRNLGAAAARSPIHTTSTSP